MHNVYTVGQINNYIKNMFKQDFLLSSLTVKGEISNCKYHSSGHIYFTLKDGSGAISCVMFRSARMSGLKFQMQEGQQVQVTGSVDVYERDGKYQLYATKIELDGAGALFERYEKLKEELAERGMFAPEYKQLIPRYIKTLGVVTAPTGAAVQDIINIATRRNPYIQIILYPAIVQGADAAPSIVKGIETLSAMDVDVIIAGRGGGSIEDLWAFNEEIVAEAIFNCPIPIISAVGHETDTTIADYVADLRAPTPSAAAELAVYEYQLFLEDIEARSNILYSRIDSKLQRLRDRAASDKRALQHLSPTSQIREKKMRAVNTQEKLEQLMISLLKEKRHQLSVDIERLKALSPLDKLQSGFSYVSDEKGSNVKTVGQVKADDPLDIFVSDGVISAVVKGTEKRSY